MFKIFSDNRTYITGAINKIPCIEDVHIKRNYNKEFKLMSVTCLYIFYLQWFYRYYLHIHFIICVYVELKNFSNYIFLIEYHFIEIYIFSMDICQTVN